MRAVLPSLLAIGLLAAPLARASECARTADKTAFDIAGLKSQLMVTAISCQAEEKYNGFVVRYRPILLSGEKGLTTYFNRSYGRSGQKQHDDYITLLANAQSQQGIQQGTLFCDKNVGLFEEVMKLKSPADLPAFATSKQFQQPIVLVDCPAPTAKVTKTAKK